MKFYALVLWRMRGVVPTMLQLVYLGNGEIVRYSPDEADLLATERKVKALWTAIERAATDRRLAPVPVEAVRLVRPPRPLPRVGRHPSAAAGASLPARRRPRGDRPRRPGRRVTLRRSRPPARLNVRTNG